MPRCDTEAMNLHLAEIATQIAPGAHAAILVDQAGWHLSAGLIVPPNITLIPLPAKCPELNPQENVWQFMRENWLSNRIFKSFDDIVDHCCDAWNKLVDQPLPIRLSPTPTKCRVYPFPGIKLVKGRRDCTAGDSEQRAERVEGVETPIESKREFVEIGL